LFHLVGKHTGRSWKEIEKDFERDRYMNAIEARDYGLVDELLGDTSDIVQIRNGEIIVPPLQITANGAS
jgi:ATP-dependent Clp protease protease subunit